MIRCYSSCFFDISLILVVFLKIILTSSHVGEEPVVFICCERPVIFLSFYDFSPLSFCSLILSFNFLLVSPVCFLKLLSQSISKVTPGVSTLSNSFVYICPLKSFDFVKAAVNPYLLATLLKILTTHF